MSIQQMVSDMAARCSTPERPRKSLAELAADIGAEICTRCKGGGRAYGPKNRRFVRCRACGGIGMVTTEQEK
jgi:hypothetical protein